MRQDDQLHFGEDPGLIALRSSWHRALNALTQRVNKPLYESVIKPVTPLSFDGKTVWLGVPTEFALYWVNNKYSETIREVLSGHLGAEIEIRVKLLKKESNDEAALPGLPEGPEAVPADSVPDTRKNQPAFVLNESYNFDSFVVGPSNRMAYAASCAVAQSPGDQYNPLFIYAGTGLGKTHLLHSIAHFIARMRPKLRLMYTSGEAFTTEFVEAVTERRTAQFRKRFRNIDVLLLDDVHFLAGKERTKEEFFHTFNALYEVGRQVVLTSDMPPHELHIDDRLQSRFESGLVVDIAPPELETRMAIIRSKAEKQDLEIPNEVVLHIARLIRFNIRAIEGALMKLHAYTDFMREPISMELASNVLDRYYEKPKETPITEVLVIEVVSKYFQISVRDICSTRRDAQIVLARQMAMFLMREMTRASLPGIGRALGGRDHATVMHAVKKISRLVAEDPKIADDVSRLVRELKQEPPE